MTVLEFGDMLLTRVLYVDASIDPAAVGVTPDKTGMHHVGHCAFHVGDREAPAQGGGSTPITAAHDALVGSMRSK